MEFWIVDVMKLSFKKLFLGVVFFSLLGGAAVAQTRVATVDLQKVFDNYWKTKQAIAALKDRSDEFARSLKELDDTLKTLKQDYQKLLDDAGNPAISGEERDKRKQAAESKLKEAKSKQEELTRFDQQAWNAINEQKARLRKNIFEEIKLVISSKAKSAGFSLVIDTGSQTYVADPSGPYYTPTLLFNSEENDLTQAVLTQLNSNAPADAVPPAAEKK
jgi:outer membrane protein